MTNSEYVQLWYQPASIKNTSVEGGPWNTSMRVSRVGLTYDTTTKEGLL